MSGKKEEDFFLFTGAEKQELAADQIGFGKTELEVVHTIIIKVGTALLNKASRFALTCHKT